MKSCADIDVMSQALSEGLEPILVIQTELKPSLFWEISNMTKACKAVVRLISLWFNWLPQRVCSACESLSLNYVAHCLLWCNVNASYRHKMWTGVWSKFGVDL